MMVGGWGECPGVCMSLLCVLKLWKCACGLEVGVKGIEVVY